MNALTTPCTQPLTMTSREIAELTGKDHGNVMRDIRNLLQELQASNLNPGCKSSTYPGSNGQDYPQYELDKDTTLALLLGYDAAARFRVGKRWQELEAKPTDLSRMDILKLAMDSEQARIEAEEKLAIAAPKADYVDRYVAANGSMGFRQVTKLLKANEHEFRAWLQEEKIMYRLGNEWTAYQNHIDAGRFVVKSGVAKLNEHAFNTTKFTPKGVNWIAGEWGKHRIAPPITTKENA